MPVNVFKSDPIGRFLICADASMRCVPSDRPRNAAKKRAAVPALPTYTAASFAGTRPPWPFTVTRNASSSTVVSMPSFCTQSKKCLESSEKSTPLSTLSPFASAAKSSALFVILFDPGTFTVILGCLIPFTFFTRYSSMQSCPFSF